MADIEFDIHEPQPDVVLNGLRLYCLALAQQVEELAGGTIVTVPPSAPEPEPAPEPPVDMPPEEPALTD